MNDAEIESILNDLLPYIRAVAWRQSWFDRNYYPDLMQAGMIGVIYGCRQFKPGFGTIQDYVRGRIRSSITDEVRQHTWGGARYKNDPLQSSRRGELPERPSSAWEEGTIGYLYVESVLKHLSLDCHEIMRQYCFEDKSFAQISKDRGQGLSTVPLILRRTIIPTLVPVMREAE